VRSTSPGCGRESDLVATCRFLIFPRRLCVCAPSSRCTWPDRSGLRFNQPKIVLEHLHGSTRVYTFSRFMALGKGHLRRPSDRSDLLPRRATNQRHCQSSPGHVLCSVDRRQSPSKPDYRASPARLSLLEARSRRPRSYVAQAGRPGAPPATSATPPSSPTPARSAFFPAMFPLPKLRGRSGSGRQQPYRHSLPSTTAGSRARGGVPLCDAS
jgi:hypothetical protein